MSNGNGETNLESMNDVAADENIDLALAVLNDTLRDTELEEVGWNRYRQLINMLRGHDNTREIGEDLRLLVRFASATHQYLRREKELDYVLAAFKALPLGPKGIHF